MWILTKILTFLSSGALKAIFTHLENNKKLDNDTYKLNNELLSEAIKSEIAERAAITEQTRLEHGWWVTAWIRPMFVYPIVLYNAAIFFDSVFNISWYDVQRIPSEQEKWAWLIITFYFGGRSLERVSQIVMNRKR